MADTDRDSPSRDPSERRLWGDVFADLSVTRREGEPSVEDLERLAVAACMVGRDDESESAWVAAHQAWLGAEWRSAPARCAFWHALGLFRGDLAPATGALRRRLERSPGSSR